MEPLQHTTALFGASRPWNSHNMPLYFLGGVGRGTPTTLCRSVLAQSAVKCVQCAAALLVGSVGN